jgi:hypothetical protein
MNKFILLFSILLCFKTWGQTPIKIYEETITEADLKRHLTYIASDELEGRDTGSEGQKKAAKYIVEHFKSIGLMPIVKTESGEMSYYQNFNLHKTGWKENYVKINDSKKVFFKDFYPVGLINIPEEKTIETVFVGYGIKHNKHDDYKNLDLKNKAVIYLEGEPKDKAGNYIISNSDVSEWISGSGTRKKQKIATDLGASYTFEVSLADLDKFKTLGAERKAILSRFNRLAIEKSKGEKISTNPSFVISKSMAIEMLGLKTKKFENYVKNPLLSLPVSKKRTNIKIKSERGEDLVETANIMGYLEGTDKKEEVVVVTAHYDHVGIDDKGLIYNGADDDGSGTCSVMELAEAFAKAKAEGHGPRRSILFMLVTGEEKGLLGSQYFTDFAPVIPLDKIMCDINIDMIGRIDKKHAKNPNYVYLIGSDKLSSDLHKISEQANQESVKFELDYEFNDPNDPNKFYYRSDHYNFAKNKIPVVFYFTGVHEDYHKPGDDVEKILFPKYNKIVKLVFNTVWALCNREEKIVVDSNKP